jgi:hypothetical protein
MSPDSSSDPDPSVEDPLNEIFGFLEKSFPDGAGESAVLPELRQQMEKFAEGKIPVAEIEALCTQILRSPESIRTFAQILGGA